MKKFLLLAVVLFFAVITAKSQSYCPPNIDFEQGTFNHWICNTGSCTANSTTTLPAVLTYPAVPTGPTTGQHTIRTSGHDYYGGFPVVNPITGNSYSLQLGDTLETASLVCARATYAVHVPINANNYSLQYYYAVVLENGGHLTNSQPYFTATVFDSANNSIVVQCASYAFIQPTNGHLPSFYGSPHLDKSNGDSVFFKPWTPSTISLNGLAGHTIYVQFDVSDCAGGAHSGYAYVDFATACQLPVIVQGYCPGSPTAGLYGPNGFQHYKWFDSTLTTLLDTMQAYTIAPAPTDTTKYILVVLPYQGFGCPDTMTTYLTAQPPPVANFGYPDHYCAGSVMNFVDSSYSITPGTFITHWKWNFGDPNANASNPNTDTTQNPRHVYSALGTYTCCLVSTSSISCVSDTQCYQIHIDRMQPPLPIILSKDTICGPTDLETISTTFTPIAGATYTWTVSGGQLVSGNLNSISQPLVVKWNSVGVKYIDLTVAPPIGDDTDCWVHNQTSVYVRGIYPSFFLIGNDSICIHEQDTINLPGRPALCGPTNVVCSSPSTFSIGTNSSTTACSSTLCLPTPFRGFYTESKMQMLILASELQAAGFQGGPLTELDFNVLAKNSSTPACNPNGQYAGFTIKLACVPYSTIYSGATAAFDLTTQLTTVYTTNSYNTSLGLNSFVFQTAYNWDGVSNLLVQTCYDAGSSCYTYDDQVAKSTMPNNQMCVQSYSDSYNGCDTCYGGTCGGFVSSFPDRPDVILKGCSENVPATTVFTWTTTPASAGFPSNQQNLYVSPAVTTTYHLNANNQGCHTYDSFKINVLTVNTVAVPPSATICSGKIMNLIATATGPIPSVPVPCGINSFGGCTAAPSIVQVGTGTVTSSTYSPFDNNYNNGRVVMRYPAAALQAQMGVGPKIISAIQFNVTSHGSFFPYVGLTVKMQCYNPTWPAWSGSPVNYPAGGSVVYGPANYSTTAGWNTITLANSYNWDGASDLLIEICFASATFSGQDVVKSTTQASNCAIYAGNGTIPLGCAIPSGSISNLLPNIKFSYCNFPVNINQYNFHWVANPSNPSPFMSSVDNDTVMVNPFVKTTFTAFLLGTNFCPVFTSDTFTVAPAFTSTSNHDTTVCVGQKVSLFAVSDSANATIVKWKWYSKKHNTINCDTCATPLITVNTGKDTIVVLQSTASGCSRYDTILIDTFPTPIASFVLDKSVECSKIKVVATATTSTTNGAVTYYWNFNNPDYFAANTTNNIDTAYWINTSTTPLVKTITLKVQQNGCFSSTIGLKDTIHANPIAHIVASDTEFCSGLIVNESSVGSTVENTLTANYNWWSNPIVTTPANLSGAGPNSFTVNLPNDSTTRVWVYLQITENGCVSNVDSEALTVHGMPSARFRATPNPSCSGDSIHFVYTGKLDPVGSQAHQLTWTFTNGSPASYTSNSDYAASLYFNNKSSVANNGVSLTVTQNTCKSAPYNADVFINPLPNVVIVGPRDICENQISYLTTDVPYQQYTWQDNYGVVTHNDSLGVSKDLTITLNVVDFNNCKGNASVQVTAHPNPVANAGEDQIIFAGNSAHLDGSMSAGGDSYTWIPSHTVNDAHSMLPIATPPQTTSYVLIYTNSQLGCVDYDTVIVHVKDCKPLVIPNAFTPFNNDNVDDYFMILNPDDYYKLLHMEIYNRWGQLLYSTNDKNSKGWDGRYQDVEQPIGTYIYNITAECGGGKLIQLKGDVTLLR